MSECVVARRKEEEVVVVVFWWAQGLGRLSWMCCVVFV